MASWEQIGNEIQARAQEHPGLNAYDELRREKLRSLKAITGRPVLMYAADFTTPKVTFTPQLQQLINITLADKD